MDQNVVTTRSGSSLLIPITVAAAFFMEGLDSTIINTALPQIAKSFDVAATEVSGAITSYLLSLAIFIPLSGWLADRFGGRRVYTAAIVVFSIGSLCCALASNTTALVASRLLQGFGGALMTPVGRLILARSFPKHELIRAMSFMVIPGLVGPMVGPVVGGFITTYMSWRWVFLVNLPLGVVGVALALIVLEPIESEHPGPFDFRGFALIAVAFGFLQMGFDSLANLNLVAWRTGAMFACTVAALAAYYFHARNRLNPVLSLAIFRLRTFSISVLAGALSRIGIASAAFLVPLLLQVAFGMSAFHSGLLTFVMAIGQIVMRFGIAHLLRRIGVRRLLIWNTLAMAVALTGLSVLRLDTPDWIIVVYLFGYGIMQSAQFSTLAALNFSGVSSAEMSRATAVSAVTQRFSMGIGIALSAFLLNRAAGGAHLTAIDFVPALAVMAAIEVSSLVGFVRLRRDDGSDLTARR